MFIYPISLYKPMFSLLQSIGSQLWDTAFTVQAVMASHLADEFGTHLQKANNFIKESQVSIFISISPVN